MAKKNEENCKEKEKLKSEKEALLARMKQLEAKNSLVVDELSKANEKVQELTQMKDNLLTQRGTLNADKNKLKEKLKWRNETQYILSEALEKAKENIARLEKSLAQEVKDNERVKKELEVSRNDAQEANNKAAANNEREVEAIKKRKEYEAILADLRDHESKTTVSRLTILRRIPK
jgi:chromosome segregation ATPase